MLLKYRGNEHYLSSLVIVRTFLQGIKLFELLSFVEGPGEVQIRTIVLFIRYSLVFTTFVVSYLSLYIVVQLVVVALPSI